MDEMKYRVSMNRDCVAENIPLDVAAILVKALFETYWAIPGLTLSITRQDVELEDQEEKSECPQEVSASPAEG